MKQDAHIPSAIEKFREQRQRLKKILLGFIITIAVMIAVPLLLRLMPGLRDSPGWTIFGNAWLCLFTIAFVVLAIIASFDLICPACGKHLGRSFSIVHHCPYCGTKLTED